MEPALRLLASMAVQAWLRAATGGDVAHPLGPVLLLPISGSLALAALEGGLACDAAVLSAEVVAQGQARGLWHRAAWLSAPWSEPMCAPWLARLATSLAPPAPPVPPTRPAPPDAPAVALDLVSTRLTAAVRAGCTPPDLSTLGALRHALQTARAVGISAGPSGRFLRHFLHRLAGEGLDAEALAARLRSAPAGEPVGAMVARGEVDLGFQQRSELLPVAGLQLLDRLPAELGLVTRFQLVASRDCANLQRVQALAHRLTTAADASTLRRHGLEPPTPKG